MAKILTFENFNFHISNHVKDDLDKNILDTIESCFLDISDISGVSFEIYFDSPSKFLITLSWYSLPVDSTTTDQPHTFLSEILSIAFKGIKIQPKHDHRISLSADGSLLKRGDVDAKSKFLKISQFDQFLRIQKLTDFTLCKIAGAVSGYSSSRLSNGPPLNIFTFSFKK